MFLVFLPRVITAQNTVILPLNDEVSEHLEYKSKRSNILHGDYAFKYKNKIQLKGRFADNQKQGLWCSFYPTGAELFKAAFKAGQLNGEFTYLNSENKGVAKGKFTAGKPEGTWNSTYGNGQPRRRIVFAKNGFPEKVVDFFPTGDIAVNTDIEISNGDTVIEAAYYYQNTNIARFTRIKNRQLSGRQIIYHQNGAVREELIYENGLLSKVGQVRTAIGKPLDASTIFEGNGKLQQHYQYGGLYAEMNYKNGALHDSVKKYQAGKLRLSGVYDHGKPAGRRVIRGENYHINYVFDFSGDTFFYQKKRFAHLESKEEGVVVNGKKNGLTKVYDGLGKPVREVAYQNGLKHGNYFENIPGTESLRVKGQYQNGVRTGKWYYFNGLGQTTYRELYENNPVLKANIYEIPEGYTALVPKGFGDRVNETFLEDIPVHSDLAYFLAREYCPHSKLPGFDFFSQEAVFDFELRNVGIGFAPDFNAPEFQGDEERYIFKHMFPQSIELPASGSVILRYKVDVFGVVSEVQVIRSIHEELDEEAVRLIESYPVMIPARYNGIPLPVYVLKSISY